MKDARLPPAREAEIIEELSQHLDERWRTLVASGASPEEAEREARRAFSDRNALAPNLAALRQAHWTDPAPPGAARAVSIEGLVADVRQAVRALRASPSFSVVSLLVLALGIGATTAIFSVVDAVVLHALPFDEADRLVAVGRRMPASGPSGPGRGSLPSGFFPGQPGFSAADPDAISASSPQNWLEWVAGQQVFESMAAVTSADRTLRVAGGDPEELRVEGVTASFFDVLRARTVIGRTFTADEEVEGRYRVAVLSHAFWQRRFGGKSDVVGQTLALGDDVYEVVGVLPAGLPYSGTPANAAALWVPYLIPPGDRVRTPGRPIGLYVQVIARLKPGITIEQAQAQLTEAAAAIEQADPQPRGGSGVGVRPLADHVIGARMRSWMLMLLAAVGLVLLIACANVANLLLARAAARERDVAVCIALGASRWRLIRQFLVESLMLSFAGFVLGTMLAWWAVEILRAAIPDDIPRAETIAINLRVLAAAAGLAVATGSVFGLAPAILASRPRVTHSLNQGPRSGGPSRARRRLRGALVVGEIALAVVLVVGSALFVASFIRVMSVDTGFTPDGVLTMQVVQRAAPGQPPSDLTAELTEVVDRLARVPGVVSAAASTGIPLRLNSRIGAFTLPGRTTDPRDAVSIKTVTPGYHQTFGIRLVHGRFFAPLDRQDAPPVAILNAAAARHFFGDADAIGRSGSVNGIERTVVGIVADARQGNIESAPVPEVYLPLAQGSASSAFVAVRTSGDPHRMLPPAGRILSTLLPGTPFRAAATMDEVVAGQTAQRRFAMLMLGLLGALGLIIASAGVYGVMAYLVSQRTREIGVRMALGATRWRVMRSVVVQAGSLAATGVAIGAICAWSLTGTLQAFLFELEAHDLRAFTTAGAVLLASAVLASLIPARRAASVDPTVALRSE